MRSLGAPHKVMRLLRWCSTASLATTTTSGLLFPAVRRAHHTSSLSLSSASRLQQLSKKSSIVAAAAAAAATSRSFGSSQDEINDDSSKKIYILTGETTTDNKSSVTVNTDTGHTLQTDVPKKMGGKDVAPQPVETLITAWIGCTQATALFVGRNMPEQRLILDRLVFDVYGERDERGAIALPIDKDPPVPSRLTRLSGTITVYRAGGKPITEEEMNLLHEQTELRCPIANMLVAGGCEMNVLWIDGSQI